MDFNPPIMTGKISEIFDDYTPYRFDFAQMTGA